MSNTGKARGKSRTLVLRTTIPLAILSWRLLPTRTFLAAAHSSTVFHPTRKKSWYNRDRCSRSWIKFDSSRWKTRRRQEIEVIWRPSRWLYRVRLSRKATITMIALSPFLRRSFPSIVDFPVFISRLATNWPISSHFDSAFAKFPFGEVQYFLHFAPFKDF